VIIKKETRKPAEKNVLIRGKNNSGKTHIVHRIVCDFERNVGVAGFFTKKRESRIVTIQQWNNFSVFDNGPVSILIDQNEECI
jgi:nucleoside-triphosphatase THEP1